MTLILLRHGQSQWNLENRFTGFHDAELTAQGRGEAKTAGEKLKAAGHKITTAFSSTLQRAHHTAKIALDAAGYPIELIKHNALRERDYGDLTGLNKAETAEKYGEAQVHIWRRSYDVAPPGGESLADVVARVKTYYNSDIKPKIDAGETVLVAAHGNSLRALLIILGLHTPETIETAELDTGVPLVVDFAAGKATEYTVLN